MPAIAFCEDNATERETLGALLDEYARERRDGTTVDRYPSGAALLSALFPDAASAPDNGVSAGPNASLAHRVPDAHSAYAAAPRTATPPASCPYDLYVLDVIMPGPSGIDVGLQLRAKGLDAPIVYLTISREYAVESYQVHAADYLVKPVAKPALFAALDRALSLAARHRTAGIVVKCREGVRRLDPERILCAELKGRAVRYTLSTGEAITSTTIRSSFRAAVEDLAHDERFILCGASHLANLQHVTAVSRTDLTLSNGMLVPLSRDRATDVKRRWMNFWLERGQ